MLYEGTFAPPTGRLAIIASRFNSVVVDLLITGAKDTLSRHGVAEDQCDLVRVPGSFEIPLIAQKLAQTGKYEAIICLGAIIRGDTDHYDHVAGGTTSGIAHASLKSDIPVIFGILTCENMDQAINRAGGKAGNKGSDAALTAIEMVNLIKKLPK